MKDQAIEFLKRILPPGPGFYSYSKVFPDKPFTWRDQVLTSVEDIAECVFTGSKDGANTYFAPSIFEHPAVLIKNKIKFRVATNAIRQKALWLDIDAKGREGEYSNVKEAIQNLASFLTAMNLPEPCLVNSGQGLHVYWPFTLPLECRQWLFMADMLKALTNSFGLKVDHHRTSDAASVLRTPGTINYGKDGKERPVSLLLKGAINDPLQLAKILKQNVIATGQAPQQSRVVTPSPVHRPQGSAEIDDIVKSFRDGSLKKPEPIVEGCRHILNMASASYMPWFFAIKILTYCENGRELAHSLSKGDPRYDYDAVEAKFYEAQQSIGGPPKCTSFEEETRGASSEWCTSCRFRHQFTTPLQCPEIIKATDGHASGDQFFREKDKSIESHTVECAQDVRGVPWKGRCSLDISAIPASLPVTEEEISFGDFTIKPGQGIYWLKANKTTDEAGNVSYQRREQLINESTLKMKCVNVVIEGGQPRRTYVFEKYHSARGYETVEFSINEHHDKVHKWLKNNSLAAISPKYDRQMEDFMNAYISKLQNLTQENVCYDRFGWHEVRNSRTKNTERGYLIGHTMYLKGHTTKVSLAPRCHSAADKEFIRKGDLETWKKAVDLYRVLDQKEAQLFICAAFAAPFMYMGKGTAQNIQYALYDTYGGRGKSSLLQVINSIWGEPQEMFFKSQDTDPARYQNMAMRNSLPVCVDEITTMNEQKAIDMLYEISGGREKRRSLSAGRGFIESGHWKTVTFFSSNRSLYELMEQYSSQNTAPDARVIEFKCEFEDYTGTPAGKLIDASLDLTKDNYGLAGPYMIQNFLNNDAAEQFIKEMADKLFEELKRASKERFWAAGLAIALAGGAYAKSLGLINYDLGELARWTKDSMLNIRRQTERENTPATIIRDFLNEHLRSILLVTEEDRPKDMKAQHGRSLFEDLYVLAEPSHKILVRMVASTGNIYISYTGLQAWCKQRHMSLKTLLAEAYAADLVENVKPEPVSLGKWVPSLGRGQTRAITVKGKKLEFDYGEALQRSTEKVEDSYN